MRDQWARFTGWEKVRKRFKSYVDEMREKYGEESDIYRIRVKGEVAAQSGWESFRLR